MILFACIVNIVLIALDQISKYYVVKVLKPIDSFTVIDGIFNFTFVENRGAAFGMFQGGRWIFVIVTIAILVGIYWYYMKLPNTKVYNLIRVALVLISAGAIGNFIDRFRVGYVVDFLHATFIEFPVFNLADVYVVTGTILLGVLLLFFIKDVEK